MPIEFKYTTEEFEYTVTVYDYETELEEEDEEEIEEENVVCNFCGRSFASPGNLKQHQTVKGHNDQG